MQKEAISPSVPVCDQTSKTCVIAIFPIWVKSVTARQVTTGSGLSHLGMLCLLLWLRLWLESTIPTLSRQFPLPKVMAVQRYTATSGESFIAFRVVGLKRQQTIHE
ncbi:MAG: hypothetical protein CFE35_18800 [Novosphingobium sp. PASSN1]|nr:MAG: hypothetical protein CFE35_18800 [Novosphingobium sp. PASSN1]